MRGKILPSRIKSMAQAYGKKIYKKLVKPVIRAAKKSVGIYETAGPKVHKRHKIGAEEWSETAKWVHVHSSNVKAIMYDEDDRQLFVEFLGQGKGSGAIYVYYDVPSSKAKGLFDAGSIGKFLHWQIKTRGYSYSRLK